jgi:hypothetical protein
MGDWPAEAIRLPFASCGKFFTSGLPARPEFAPPIRDFFGFIARYGCSSQCAVAARPASLQCTPTHRRTNQHIDVHEEITMFARSLTLRACGLFASIVLTTAMLGTIGVLAQTPQAEPALATSQGVGSEHTRVPG